MSFSVSVIIPTFNRALVIKRALRSLEVQTFKDFKVIVVDDGSVDNTREVVTEFVGRLNITYIFIPNSGGPARPRNLGAEYSDTNYISFLDSDDTWDANRLQVVMTRISPGSINCHMLRIVNGSFFGKSKIKPVQFQCAKEKAQQLLFVGNDVPLSSIILKRDLFLSLGGFNEDPKYHGWEDYDFLLRGLFSGVNLHVIDSVLGSYFNSFDSISSARFRIKHNRHIKAEYFAQCARPGWMLYSNANSYLSIGEPKMAVRYFRSLFKRGFIKYSSIFAVKFFVAKIL